MNKTHKSCIHLAFCINLTRRKVSIGRGRPSSFLVMLRHLFCLKPLGKLDGVISIWDILLSF